MAKYNIERLEYLDIAKGLLILLVVFGHFFPEGIIRTWIYSFHIPAFFVVSGITSNYSHSYKLDFKTFIKKKTRSILCPLLYFEVLGIVGRLVRFGFKYKWYGILFDTISLYFNNTVNWYLFALFFSELLIYILRTKKIAFEYILYIFCLSIGVLLPSGHVSAVFSWILLGTGFIGLGSKLEKKIEKYSREPIVLTLCVLILTINLCLSEQVSIYDHEIGNPLIFLLVAGAGILLTIGTAQYMQPSILENIGRCSLWIMGTHLPVNNFVHRVLENKLPDFMLPIISFIFVLVLNLGVKKLVNGQKSLEQ